MTRLHALLCIGFLTATPAMAQSLSYTATTPLRLPRDAYFGEVSGVATNAKGDVFVLTHTGHPNASLGGGRVFAKDGTSLFEFDPQGKFVREIGKDNYGFLSGEQVRIDPHDNIWAVDGFTNTVMEFDPTGQNIIMVLGRKEESIDVPAAPPRPPRGNALPGAGQHGDVFDHPTDVAWDAAGNIYIADGLGNQRIAKFDPKGKFVASWGSRGTGEGQFAGIQSIAVDASGNIYAADTANHRIEVLDSNGRFQRQITGVGAPAALCLSTGSHPYLFSSNSNPVDDLDTGGEIYKLELNGNPVGRFGRAGKNAGDFDTVNAIDCRNSSQLYVGEIGDYRVQKLDMH